MTWTVNIVNAQNEAENCVACKHSEKNTATPSMYIQPPLCNIKALESQLGYLLTAVDIGADGHMASGLALLKCYGFERRDDALSPEEDDLAQAMSDMAPSSGPCD